MTCARCHCIRAALGEAGLDPDRVFCSEDLRYLNEGICSVGCGTGTEGRTNEEVEAIVDKAFEVCGGAGP